MQVAQVVKVSLRRSQWEAQAHQRAIPEVHRVKAQHHAPRMARVQVQVHIRVLSLSPVSITDQAEPMEVVVPRQQRSLSLFLETHLEYLEAMVAAMVVAEILTEVPTVVPTAAPTEAATAAGTETAMAMAMGATELSHPRTPFLLEVYQRLPAMAAMEPASRHHSPLRQVQGIPVGKEETAEVTTVVMVLTMEVVPPNQLSQFTSLKADQQDLMVVQEDKDSRHLTALAKVPPLQVDMEETPPDSSP